MKMTHDFAETRAHVAALQAHHAEQRAAVTALCEFRMPGGIAPFLTPHDSIVMILDQIHAFASVAEAAIDDQERAAGLSELAALNPDLVQRCIAGVGTLSALASFFAHNGVENVK